ncbi:uncharacterized protein EV420DRAFT_1680322 [Desarmillaria tabescens]|uniref:Uncharacterized protein n=1 Tax=Armillaria tabescens TaxID=1929756 RepID=A0AA39J2D0_ARMTA|nr:uncharacterized protein EV420DRAFT_1680322 [Desarmillaria tabescens]KAK0434856.1 hypothetical protein EV420DRAFT_1680322 [Desarmillaria tabescens]
MAWAPEAIWDADAEKYLVYWSSRFYDADDTAVRPGISPPLPVLMYIHSTLEQLQRTVSYPPTLPTSERSLKRWITSSYLALPIIDLTILPLSDGEYIRFIKNETVLHVWAERSNGGLFGTWTKIGDGYVNPYVTEGPLAFHDNEGYVPQYTDDGGVTWVNGDRSNFPALTKHGVVVPVNQTQYDAIEAKWV